MLTIRVTSNEEDLRAYSATRLAHDVRNMAILFLRSVAAGFSDLAIEAAGCCQALDGAYVCPSGSMNFTIDILSSNCLDSEAWLIGH